MNRKTVLTTLGVTTAAVWLGVGITYAAKVDRGTLGATAETTTTFETVALVPVPPATTTTISAPPVETTTVAYVAVQPLPATTVATTASAPAPVARAAPADTSAPTTSAPPETTTTTIDPSPPSTGSLDHVPYPQEPTDCQADGVAGFANMGPGDIRLMPSPHTVWTFTSVVIDGAPAPAPALAKWESNAGSYYPIHYTTSARITVSVKTVGGQDCLGIVYNFA